jgi:MSHA biogenesis protein MshO
MRSVQKKYSGFTLLEMIIVIVITGIIGSMMAVFINAPVQGYVDSSRRAEMTDIADTALRRLARDIRTAVPNSVRLTGATAIEFLPTKTGGRYRANAAGGASACALLAGDAGGDALTFGVSDTCFGIIGTVSPAIIAGDYIVVGSTQSNGAPPYDESAAGVLRVYDSVNGNASRVALSVPDALPLFAEQSSQRFQVVDGTQQAVTYACENDPNPVAAGDGPLRLMRHWSYWDVTSNIHPPFAGGGIGAVLASNIRTCNIVYDAVNQRNGLVAITLEITRGGESISLYHTIHVNNAP